MKTGRCRNTFWRLISEGRLKFVCVLVLSAIVSPSLSTGQNLVNLYDWSNVTVVGTNVNPNIYVFNVSPTSASFESGFTLISGSFVQVQPTITGTLDTIPAAAYEISFTAQDDSAFGPNSCQVYFGNTYTDIDLPPDQSGPGGSPTQVYVDFTAVATSATTTMTFVFGMDPSDDVDGLFNLSVTEVPEVSSGKLFLFLGGGFLCVRKWRRLMQKPKAQIESPGRIGSGIE